MASRSPNIGVILIILFSMACFLALPVWGWGNVGGFIDHPARVGTCLVVTLASLAVLFTGANWAAAGVRTGERPYPGARNRFQPADCLAARLRRPPRDL